MGKIISDLSLIEDRFIKLKKSITDSTEAFKNTKKIKWFNFKEDSNPDRYKDEEIKETFKREQISEKYTQLIEKGLSGVEAELVAVKTMNDWIASLERDFRMRTSSRIKSIADTATTWNKLTSEKGNIDKGIKAQLEGLIMRQGRQ